MHDYTNNFHTIYMATDVVAWCWLDFNFICMHSYVCIRIYICITMLPHMCMHVLYYYFKYCIFELLTCGIMLTIFNDPHITG